MNQSAARNASAGSLACNSGRWGGGRDRERERERTRRRRCSLPFLHPPHATGQLRNKRDFRSLRRRSHAVTAPSRKLDLKVRGPRGKRQEVQVLASCTRAVMRSVTLDCRLCSRVVRPPGIKCRSVCCQRGGGGPAVST